MMYDYRRMPPVEPPWLAVGSGQIIYQAKRYNIKGKQHLKTIKDHYPKLLLTMDDDPEIHYDGIRRVNVRDWLLSD